MALPSPATGWKLVKWLIKQGGEILPPAVAYLLLQLDEDEEADPLRWVRVHVLYSRYTPSGTQEDLAQFKLDLVNITGGALDTSWTAGDFSAVDSALDTFTTAIRPYQANTHTLHSYRYYGMGFNDADPGPSDLNPKQQRPFADTGGPVYVIGKSGTGTATATHPYQVAATITLKTGWPKHWGRIYIPGAALPLDPGARWGGSQMQTVANAMFDLNDDLAAAGFLLTVPVAQVNKQRYHALLGVNSIVMDDIPDVVRRRRPREVKQRFTGVE